MANLDIGPLQTGGAPDIGALQSASTGAQTITAATPVSHSRSVPSPTVTGGAGYLALARPVGPHRGFLNPTVAGPITAGSLSHGRAIPAPTVTVKQMISLGAPVAGPRAIPAGRVANVQTIRPAAAVAHSRSIPSPVMAGGPQYLAVKTVTGRRAVPTPVVTGGFGGTFIYLSGADRSIYLNVGSGTGAQVLTIASKTLGRWNASFDLYVGDGSFVPQLGQTVLVVDHGRRLFAGCIVQLVAERLPNVSTPTTFHVTAVDKSGICDHRIVTRTYSAVDTNGNAVDVVATILDIVANFLNGEGISVAVLPATGALGSLVADLSRSMGTVTTNFDDIASQIGLVWWIDGLGQLHFEPFDALPSAPFNITESSNNWRNLLVTTTTTNYYNKLYAVSNLNVVPGSGSGGGGTAGQAGNTETFTFTVGQPGVVSVLDSSGTAVAVGILASVGIGAIISMTVAGHDQTVYAFDAFAGQTRANSNDYVWVYATGGTQLSWTFAPPAGATIVLKYTPGSATSVSTAQYGTALAPQSGGHPLGTCGSGVYEGVVQVTSISDQGQLNAIAAAELARIGGVPTVVDYETDVPGLQPGQLQTVNVPNAQASNLTIMLTQVSGTWIPGGLSAENGAFRWAVQGTTNLDPGGSYEKWFERLIRRTENALPLLTYEYPTFVLGSGSSLSGGTSATNPYIVGKTGQLVGVSVAASTPPTGQDLILSVTYNGGAIIATIQMPAGTAANTPISQTIDRTLAAWVYKGSVLNVNVSYAVSGSNPVPASGVTLKLSVAG